MESNMNIYILFISTVLLYVEYKSYYIVHIKYDPNFDSNVF